MGAGSKIEANLWSNHEKTAAQENQPGAISHQPGLQPAHRQQDDPQDVRSADEEVTVPTKRDQIDQMHIETKWARLRADILWTAHVDD